MLTVHRLCKRYGDIVALDGLTLDISAGEICGLLGENGAGKSTFVSIVAGLRRPDSGSIIVNEIDVLTHKREARRHIGLAPQQLGIYPSLTVRDNLIFFGSLAELSGKALSTELDRVMDALALDHLAGRLARTLSGGEKRRLHTAAAMLHRPLLLLLDEPTSGVDVKTRSSLLAAIRTMAHTDGTAICYSSHYLPEIEELQASVAIIDGGRLVARGTVPELLQQHGHSSIELEFDGSPPDLAPKWQREITTSGMRVHTARPEEDLPKLLAELDLASATLRRVELVRPSLDNVFLGVTGRRFVATESVQEGGR